jgi:hypothetical protein
MGNDEVVAFAKKYAGKRVKHDNDNGTIFIGRIVGYYDDGLDAGALLIDYPDDAEKQNDSCWSIENNSCAHLIIEGVKAVRAIEIERVSLIKEEVAIVARPYPHICKACKSPARINKSATICSNSKCSSRKKYLGPLNKQAARMLPKVNRSIKCPVRSCGLTQMRSIMKSYDLNRDRAIYTLSCVEYHTFNYEPTKGDNFDMAEYSYEHNGTDFIARNQKETK